MQVEMAWIASIRHDGGCEPGGVRRQPSRTVTAAHVSAPGIEPFVAVSMYSPVGFFQTPLRAASGSVSYPFPPTHRAEVGSAQWIPSDLRPSHRNVVRPADLG